MSESSIPLRYICKYAVCRLGFILENNDEEMVVADTTNIISIQFLNDYERHIRPILKITLRLDVRQRMWIIENKRDVICKFEMQHEGYDLVNEETVIKSAENVFDDLYNIYLNDEDESSDITVLKDRLELHNVYDSDNSDINQLLKESYTETQNYLDVFLFKPEFMEASQKTYNKVFRSDIVQNMTAHILSETGHKDVLMSPCENEEVYNELIIPANKAYKTLIYLDQYYGLYKKGAVIYYGIDTIYILNSNGDLTAKKEDEWTEVQFLVHMLDLSKPGNGMTLVEDEEVYYINLSEMDVNPMSSLVNQSNAENASDSTYVVTDSITVTTKTSDMDMVDTQIDTKHEDITNIKKRNKYIPDIMKARKEEGDLTLYISAESIDINAFKPNKIYTIAFSDESKNNKYGQYKYRLVYDYHAFIHESERGMRSSHRIVLKKVSS